MKPSSTKELQNTKSIINLKFGGPCRESKQRIGAYVTKARLVETQTTIALESYDSPEIVQEGDSMIETEQARIIIDNFGGNNDNPESISYLDQFVNGLGRFAGLFTSSEPDKSGGQIFLTMPQKLHRQKGLQFLLAQLPSQRTSCNRGT
jgi:hypothetical protein